MSCRTGSASRSSLRTAAVRRGEHHRLAAAAKADPDGYTILAQSTSHTIAPAIYPNMSYDVTRAISSPSCLRQDADRAVISPGKGIKTVQQLVAEAKAKPGAFTLRLGGCWIDDAI